MKHIQSRPMNPHEYGGISKNSICYFNHHDRQILAVVGDVKGETCFMAQKPLRVLEVSFIINDFINKRITSVNKH